MIKALTLHQPWAGIVAAGIKRIENRTWSPHGNIIGQRIAIHAGKTWDDEGASFCRDRLKQDGRDGWPRLSTIRGAVLAVTTVAGVAQRDDDLRISADQVQWFFGPFGWLLRDTVAMARPVPCSGSQGLWELPGDVEDLVLGQIDRSGFGVTDDDLDAPDGSVVDCPEQGGLFERHGRRWMPVSRKDKQP